MNLKPALTYDEQIRKLRFAHNLTIRDENFTRSILQKVNYYRLSGYGIGLKKPSNKEHYVDGITIEQLFMLYCFDSQLKNKLIKTIEQIEIEFRTQMAYHLSINYGADVLMHENYFAHKINKNSTSIFTIITSKLSNEIARQKNNPFVKHHLEKYESNFPIWVAVEIMTFGNLSSYITCKTKLADLSVSL